MTLKQENLQTETIKKSGRLDINSPEAIAILQQREQVRLRCALESLQSPLYQARAAKDPDYLKNFSTSQIR